MKIVDLDGGFGKRIHDFQIGALDDNRLLELLECLYANRFVALEAGPISQSDYVAFSRQIGDPIPLSKDPDFPEIAHISNLQANSKESRLGAAHWHTDQSFRKTVSSVTMLHSLEVPEVGGETKFCDMAAAYDALPQKTKGDIENLIVEHRHGVSVSAPKGDHTPLPPKGWDQNHTVFHPLVRRHPETGRKTLYEVTGTAQGIQGMAQNDATALLKELSDHVLQPAFTTSYKHRLHDIVMWDNPTVMHSATPIGQATGPRDTRHLWRISLRGSPPVLQRRALAEAS